MREDPGATKIGRCELEIIRPLPCDEALFLLAVVSELEAHACLHVSNCRLIVGRWGKIAMPMSVVLQVRELRLYTFRPPDMVALRR